MEIQLSNYYVVTDSRKGTVTIDIARPCEVEPGETSITSIILTKEQANDLADWLKTAAK